MIPGLAVLRGYRREWLPGDLLAGVTVAAYLVPQVMAYATIAGLPPVAALHPGGISVVGPVPARLPTVGLPTLDPGVLRELLLAAFTVLVVASATTW
jgi:MFS superfamily sulfate permease-like transporter